jgi:pimeloyl-ACP methyl ester carboxylesterase
MPTLVLLPGLDGTGDLFSPFIDAVAGQFKTQVVRYPTDRVLSYEELLAIARSALPTDEPYVLLGESFSGPIAISLAAEAHPFMRGVVLCCTFARNPQPALAHFGALLSLVPFQRTPAMVLGAALLGPFGNAALRASIAKAVGQVSSSVLRARLQSVLLADVSDKLASVSKPCLYLHATQDRLVPQSAAAHIKSVLPAVSVVPIKAPHCLLQAVPTQAVRVISSFFWEVELAF